MFFVPTTSGFDTHYLHCYKVLKNSRVGKKVSHSVEFRIKSKKNLLRAPQALGRG
jgi:hypothetical protein